MSAKPVPFFFDSSREVVIELSNNMTFGRNKDCDYPVVDHRVSGVHFKVILKDNDVYIVDLESSNSTKLNDDEMTPNTEMKLFKKDKVKFGAQQFYFYYESIENFVVPDITRTLTISNTADVVDEMMSSEQDYSGINLSISEKSTKKVSKLSELKNSKSLVAQHEISLKSITEDIVKRNTLKKEFDTLQLKISNSKSELGNAGYEELENAKKDLKSFNFSINELNECIREAQEKIDKWKKDIEDIQNKVEEVKRVELIHNCLSEDLELESQLRNDLEIYNKMNLDSKKSELEELIKKEFDNYKALQDDYANSLKYRKNKLVS